MASSVALASNAYPPVIPTGGYYHLVQNGPAMVYFEFDHPGNRYIHVSYVGTLRGPGLKVGVVQDGELKGYYPISPGRSYEGYFPTAGLHSGLIELFFILNGQYESDFGRNYHFIIQ